jgi:hypothetical protein
VGGDSHSSRRRRRRRRRRYAKPLPHIVRVLERGYGELLSDTAAASACSSSTVEEDPCRDLDVTRSLPLSPLPSLAAIRTVEEEERQGRFRRLTLLLLLSQKTRHTLHTAQWHVVIEENIKASRVLKPNRRLSIAIIFFCFSCLKKKKLDAC